MTVVVVLVLVPRSKYEGSLKCHLPLDLGFKCVVSRNEDKEKIKIFPPTCPHQILFHKNVLLLLVIAIIFKGAFTLTVVACIFLILLCFHCTFFGSEHQLITLEVQCTLEHASVNSLNDVRSHFVIRQDQFLFISYNKLVLFCLRSRSPSVFLRILFHDFVEQWFSTFLVTQHPC